MKALPLGSLISSTGKAGADARRHLMAPLAGNQVDPPIDRIVRRAWESFKRATGVNETPEQFAIFAQKYLEEHGETTDTPQRRGIAAAPTNLARLLQDHSIGRR